MSVEWMGGTASKRDAEPFKTASSLPYHSVHCKTTTGHRTTHGIQHSTALDGLAKALIQRARVLLVHTGESGIERITRCVTASAATASAAASTTAHVVV